MGAVTEFAFIPLRPGVNIEDESISEGQIMAQMLAKGKIAPGVQANYWGKQEECSHFVHLLLGKRRYTLDNRRCRIMAMN